MIKTALTLCCLLFASYCFAQEIKMTTIVSGSSIERYGVLKTDKKIKQGPYTLTNFYSRDTVTTGFYKNNMRDSIWCMYIGKKVTAKGLFKDGERFGEWIFSDTRGNVINKYNFTKNELTFHKINKADTSRMYHVLTGNDTLYTHLDHAPFYIYGDEGMYSSIARMVRYPAEARFKHVTGKVIIAFIVDEHGRTHDFHVTQGIGSGCDEEALSVVKRLEDNWVAGTIKDKPVSVVMTIPIRFSLAN
jgi:TonB family protein